MVDHPQQKINVWLTKEGLDDHSPEESIWYKQALVWGLGGREDSFIITGLKKFVEKLLVGKKKIGYKNIY